MESCCCCMARGGLSKEQEVVVCSAAAASVVAGQQQPRPLHPSLSLSFPQLPQCAYTQQPHSSPCHTTTGLEEPSSVDAAATVTALPPPAPLSLFAPPMSWPPGLTVAIFVVVLLVALGLLFYVLCLALETKWIVCYLCEERTPLAEFEGHRADCKRKCGEFLRGLPKSKVTNI
jgi:hypothetical protein